MTDDIAIYVNLVFIHVYWDTPGLATSHVYHTVQCDTCRYVYTYLIASATMLYTDRIVSAFSVLLPNTRKHEILWLVVRLLVGPALGPLPPGPLPPGPLSPESVVQYVMSYAALIIRYLVRTQCTGI